MRGKPVRQVSMLTTTTPDDLVPQDHPIRRIKPVVEDVLRSMSPTFEYPTVHRYTLRMAWLPSTWRPPSPGRPEMGG